MSQTTGEVIELASDQRIEDLLVRAIGRLETARTSAEVLEALDMAKSVAALARVKNASNEAHADCLRVIWRCQLKLDQEATKAQAEGLLAKDGRPSKTVRTSNSFATADQIGIDRRRRNEWHQVNEAGGYPVVEQAIQKALEDDRAPTDLEIRRLAKRILNAQQNDLDQELVLPEGKYRTIVIDPPWPMQKVEREVRPNQVGFEYPTMDLDAIATMDVASFAGPDCHLFMWTTQKFLPPSLEILAGWGFTYVFTMVWHKPGGFQPHNLPQYNCEFVLYGRRGTPKFVETKSFSTCCQWPRREHSRKPDEFYDVVERVTNGPRIDIFSREKRDGFEQWGNQPEHFSEAS